MERLITNTREARSQPNLPQRRWTTSGELQGRLPRSRSLSARKDLEIPERQAARQRPLTSIPSRPESRASRPASRLDSRPVSRLDSRPVSRLDSRPASRLDKHDLIAPTERPKSGTVRPLSGRIFMRRTAEKGWVAKAYPNPLSQTDLELEDDLSDCESLDSFFNDDFELEPEQDKLQNLLSCNTLGVESKGRKPDWVAGEIGIPKFHCPRCRDHWYGITAFPCDEELARLIREGLWYTGKGDPSNSTGTSRGGKFRRPVSGRKEFGSTSSDSLNLSDAKKRGRRDGSQDDPSSLAVEKGNETKKKSKKRITFKLDNSDEDDAYGGGSVGDLDGFGSGKTNRGKWLNGDNDADSGREGYGTGRKDATSRLEGGNGLIVPTGASSKLKKRRGRRGRGDGLDSEGSEELISGGGENRRGDGSGSSSRLLGTGLEQDGAGSGRIGAKTGRNRKHQNGTQGGDGSRDDVGSKRGFDGRRTGSEFYSGSTHTGLGSLGNGDIDGHDDGRGGYSNGGFSGGTGFSNGSHTNLGSLSQLHGGHEAGEGDRGSLEGRHSSSKVFQRVSHNQLSSQQLAQTGSDKEDGFDGLTSSTSLSRVLEKPSQTNITLTGRLESKKTASESDDFTLPPIVPQISNKDLDLSALMYGFQVTKPYTFSYHTSTSRTCLDGSSERPRKKR